MIQLNVVRSILIILEALSDDPPSSTSEWLSPSRNDGRPRPSRIEPDADFHPLGSIHSLVEINPEPESDSEGDSIMVLNPGLETIKLKLRTLSHVEQMLISKLAPNPDGEATHLAGPGSSRFPGRQHHPPGLASLHRNEEFFVRPGQGWKGALDRVRANNERSQDEGEQGRNVAPQRAWADALEARDEPQEMLHMLRQEMIQLWENKSVQDILRWKGIRLEQESGLYVKFPSICICRVELGSRQSHL